MLGLTLAFGSLLAFLIVLGLLVRVFEARLIYHPVSLPADWRPDLWTGQDPDPGTVETVKIPTSDGETLDGVLGRPPDPRGWLVWCHGNAGNLSDRLPTFVRFVRDARLGVLLFDYRGYGRSTGTLSEEGVYRDAVAGVDFLCARGIPLSGMVLFGRSLGGAPAIEAARRREVAGLVLEAPFTSVNGMARVLFPWFPAGRFARTRFANDEKIGSLRIPILHFHGRRDSVVPFAQGERLAALAPKDLTEFVPVDADHLDVSEVLGDEYYSRIATFVESCVARSRKG